MSIFILILLLISLPLVTAIILLIIGSNILRETILISFAFIGAIIISIIIIKYYNSPHFIDSFHIIKFTNNIYFSLHIEPFSLIFASLISILWPLTAIYAVNYMKFPKAKTYTNNTKVFYFFLCLTITATLGLAFSGNLITTFIFYEALTILTYPLITYEKTNPSEAAGKTYLSILLGTSVVLFLPAIILVYIYTGSVSYTLNGLSFYSNNKIICLIFLMFLFGVSKAALMPFHGWLPKAMVAPSPVSALIHALAVVKSGVFIILKIVIYIFGLETLATSIKNTAGFNAFLIIPVTTILIAALINLFQDNFKKLLAYSTISQLSYIICCILLLKPIGIVAATFYFISHSLSKIVLFFQAGAYINYTKKENISTLSGIGKHSQLPLITNIGTISIFSLVNLPFTLGFIAKFYLLKTIIYTAEYWLFGVLIISYICSIIYFGKTIYQFYFVSSTHFNSKITSSIRNLRLPLLFMALVMMCIVIFNIYFFLNYEKILKIIDPIIERIH